MIQVVTSVPLTVWWWSSYADVGVDDQASWSAQYYLTFPPPNAEVAGIDQASQFDYQSIIIWHFQRCKKKKKKNNSPLAG